MRERREGALTAGLLAFALLAGAAAAPGRAAPAAASIRLGVMAEEANEPDRMLRIYDDLIRLLRERLAGDGIGVGELVIARDLDDLARRLRDGEVDVVIETVFPSLILRTRSRSLEPRLVVVRRGQRQYRSVFFTRKESPIRALADLRGRTLVLQALRSTSAFALPVAELRRAGLQALPPDAPAGPGAVRYVLAGAEVNQAVWVLHGRGDAGAFNEADWEALPAGMRDRLRLFHETRPILRGLLSFRSALSRQIRARLETLLLGLAADPRGKAALERATGITRLEPLTASDRRALAGWEATLAAVGAAR